MNDYLWDRGGDADDETRELEELLGAFRSARPMPDFRRGGQAPSPVCQRLFFALPIAAMLVLGIALPAFLARRATGWHAGALAVYRPGDVIRTKAPLRIETRAIGFVDVAPGTTLRIVEKRRLALEVGTIHAVTTSPPGVFVVDTPGPDAIDLGCEYILNVADDGSGSLRVTAGWVKLARGVAQSLVPRGASASFDTEGTLTPPVFDDASAAFKEAVRRHDIARAAALARTRDAYTLLNLFSRATEDERLLLYDRLSQLVPPPPSIARESMRWWSPRVTDAWWPTVLKASGVEAIKKKKATVSF
jgi:hypothetical protein